MFAELTYEELKNFREVKAREIALAEAELRAVEDEIRQRDMGPLRELIEKLGGPK
jgi:hypothetical protein